jgi:glutamine synthetase
LRELATTAEAVDEADLKCAGVRTMAKEMTRLVDELAEAVQELGKQNRELGGESVHEKAHHVYANVLPAMTQVRKAADQLERVVPHDLWPLPTYREILWVK